MTNYEPGPDGVPLVWPREMGKACAAQFNAAERQPLEAADALRAGFDVYLADLIARQVPERLRNLDRDWAIFQRAFVDNLMF